MNKVGDQVESARKKCGAKVPETASKALLTAPSGIKLNGVLNVRR